jgi:glycosyltransferase involved in cell wall biosynthesis
MTARGRDTPRVSVVIPTHGRADYLPETLASVFEQSFREHEVIVVADGRAAGARATLEHFVRDGRVRYVEQPHAGTAAARTRGVAEARGDLIALLDHDDLWPADKLAWQVAELDADREALLVYGYMESFGLERPFRWPPPDGPTGRVHDAFLRKNWIRSVGQTLIRAEAIRAVGGFDASVRGADDWDLYLKLSSRGRFVYRHHPALRYRAHPGNQSKDAWRLFLHACRVHRRHAGRVPRVGEAARWLACRISLLNVLRNELRARRRAAATRARAAGR